MSTYTVHEPPVMKASREERAETLVFVRDGFSWGAFVFGPIYFLVKREWAGLLVFFIAMLAMGGLLELFGTGPTAITVASIVLALIAGFEANEIKRASLALFGWKEIAVISGRSLEECEQRFFNAWLPSEPSITPLAWQSSPFAAEGRTGQMAHALLKAQSAFKGGFSRIRRPFERKS